MYGNITSDVPNSNNTTDNNLKYDLFFDSFTQIIRTQYQELMEFETFCA